MQVKEKGVALIELFSDLIYVYAISRMTTLIEEPINGFVQPTDFLRYVVLSLVVLQAWLYMTNYVNRYGTWRWHEYAIAGINMMATVYVANTISTDWEQMSGAFNIAMLVMLLCVAALYFIQTRLGEQDAGAAQNSLTILSVVCGIYLVAIIATLGGVPSTFVVWLDVAAVLVGAFLPFFVRGHFDVSIISWPHLIERFELLVIMTFGEAVVGMTGFFDVSSFGIVPMLVFGILVFLYGGYVVQIHNLVEHHAQQRGLLLMFSHYFIVIAVNLMTVAIKAAGEGNFDGSGMVGLMVFSLVLFYAALLPNAAYYHEGVRLSRTDLALMAAVTAVGCAFVIASQGETHLYLGGALVVAIGNFSVLYSKQRTHQLARP